MADTTNYPWPMDKPIGEIEDWVNHSIDLGQYVTPTWGTVQYLLARLKLAEAPTIYTMRVKEARTELLDRGVPDVCDLLAAMERDNSRLTQRVKALEAENQELRYGRY